MQNEWVCTGGNEYHLREVSQQAPHLPNGIYRVIEHAIMPELYLVRIQDQFPLPEKIYGLQEGFINRVLKRYQATTGNLGIILNGLKGTGKTLTAQEICNRLEMPVLIITQAFKDIATFINEIQQNIVLMFDEFEKIYKHYDYTILTVMDGILNTIYRRVFILTTNELHIDHSLVARPGRLLYRLHYGDMNRKAIEEIVDDLLIHLRFREEVIEFLASLENISIDIIKAVISEVNIHEQGPSDFADILNVAIAEDTINVIELHSDKPSEIIYKDVHVHPRLPFSDLWVGRDLEINGYKIGEIVKVVSAQCAMIKSDDDNNDQSKPVYKTIQIERSKYRHKAFLNPFLSAYAF